MIFNTHIQLLASFRDCKASIGDVRIFCSQLSRTYHFTRSKLRLSLTQMSLISLSTLLFETFGNIWKKGAKAISFLVPFPWKHSTNGVKWICLISFSFDSKHLRCWASSARRCFSAAFSARFSFSLWILNARSAA